MKYLLLIGVVSLAACAVAFGERSTATITTHSDIKREVAASAPMIEEVLIQERK
jgi:hypothetical protein